MRMVNHREAGKRRSWFERARVSVLAWMRLGEKLCGHEEQLQREHWDQTAVELQAISLDLLPMREHSQQPEGSC